MSFKFFKCFVSLQAIWWPNFIKILSCTPEIQGHFSISAHLTPTVFLAKGFVTEIPTVVWLRQMVSVKPPSVTTPS